METGTENRMGTPAAAGGEPVRKTKISYGHQWLDEADYQAVLDDWSIDFVKEAVGLT